jgi:hypothetical protein
MLNKTDTLFGHIIDDTDKGPVYREDGTPVDFANPRPCLGCKKRCANGGHDACIENLPGTYQACCGHGLDRTPVSGRLAGYVGLKDGRTIEFSGLLGGERIRAAVDLALAGAPLPEGFTFGERMWWEGLTDAQRDYVWQRLPQGLMRLTQEVTGGELDEAIGKGEKAWHDGLTDEQKQQVRVKIPAQLAELVEESLRSA